MFIDLVDVLRCPNRHEETWLVLAADRVDDRDVVRGTLGCPICRAEFPIENGVARFDGGTANVTAMATPDQNEAMRLAALLELVDSRGFAVLVGTIGNHAAILRELTDVQLLLVDPPPGSRMGGGLSGLTTPPGPPRIPIAHDSTRGVALDDDATPALLDAALTVVMPGGRIVAPASLAVPPNVTPLARDKRQWVAERTREPAPSGIIPLVRRR